MNESQIRDLVDEQCLKQAAAVVKRGEIQDDQVDRAIREGNVTDLMRRLRTLASTNKAAGEDPQSDRALTLRNRLWRLIVDARLDQKGILKRDAASLI